LPPNVKALADADAKPTGSKGAYIKHVSVTSSMGPGLKIEPSTLFNGGWILILRSPAPISGLPEIGNMNAQVG